MNKLISKIIKCTLLLTMLTSYVVAGDKVLHVSKHLVVNTTADKLWKLVGDYNSLNQWHPAVKKSELSGSGHNEGDVRVLTLGNGATLYEELIDYSISQKSYSYRIIKSPLPVYGYLSTISIKDNGDKTSTITWKSKFYANGVPDAEAIKLFNGVYDGGLKSLQAKFK